MAEENERQHAVSRFDDEDNHGWSPDLGSGDRTPATDKAFENHPGEPATGAPVDHSPDGTLSSTDMEPEAPLSGSDSKRRSGEEIGPGPGENADGFKGAAQRPYGTSDA
ncbi:hypothetical protein VA596_25940 [Amycolatopsis sp., V23-08]|uniref:Uncharacterized protein n=1 Tax=Amycolatopsis heterodermiae TaxID=3110235 RepID=A0ABU5R9T6_9PSEU|nr:hypothetical protein [Amycolatopsis sp., V23-08]MEA5362998.1 hypothetical protein [Amycolatopsis sp., V23-08]